MARAGPWRQTYRPVAVIDNRPTLCELARKYQRSARIRELWLLRPEADPFVVDRFVVDVDVVVLRRKLHILRCQTPDLLGQVELGDGEIVLRLHQADPVGE